MMKVIKLFSLTQGLSSIQRYSQLHLLKPESVMEHTGFVCLFTYVLCEELDSYALTISEKFNRGAALERAIVHDIDEVVTGDIPRPTKYYNKHSIAVFDEISVRGIDQIVYELSLEKSSMKKDWSCSKSGKEGLVVALADLSSVVCKLWEEIVMLGNKKLFRQSKGVEDHLASFREKLKFDDHEFAMNDIQVNCFMEIISQLQEIIDSINEMPEAMHGTFGNFEAKP